MRSRSYLVLFLLMVPGSALAQTQTLYLPRFVTSSGTGGALDTSEYTGIAVANLDTALTATLTFTAYDRTGALISGTGITNPAVRTLAAGAQLPIVDFQIFGAAVTAKSPVGWIKIESTVQKVVAFFLVFNGTLTVLDGADASVATMTAFVLPEIEAGGTTQIAVANPNAESASVNFELLRSDGTTRASSSRSINPNGAVVETVSELFPAAAAAGSDYIRATSSRGVVAFELAGRPGVFVHGVNGQPVTAGATVLYCPQYVVGGSDYSSLLSVVNVDTASGTLTLDFIGDDGVLIARKTADIAGRGKLYVTSQTFFVASAAQTQGYLKITSSGPKLAGSVVFGDPNKAKFSAALPLVGTLQSTVVFGQLASNAQYFTGAAVLNPNTTSVSTTLDVLDEKGTLVATATDTILPGGRKAQLLTEFLPALTGQTRSSGYFKITAEKPVASFALFGTNDLSVLAAVPPQLLPLPPALNYDGNWSGSVAFEGGFSGTVDMTVAASKITRFKVTLNVSGITCSVETDPQAAIAGATFSFAFSVQGLSTTIGGTFTSENAMSGTYGTVTLTNFRCSIFPPFSLTLSGGTFKMSK